MKSYTLICFFLALAMILCPLFATEKTKDSISQEFFDEVAEAETVTDPS